MLSLNYSKHGVNGFIHTQVKLSFSKISGSTRFLLIVVVVHFVKNPYMSVQH